MHISIDPIEGKYPSFNVNLHTSPEREPFLTVKGVRVVDGKTGRFVSWPAKKLDSGKYWNHVWGSEPFVEKVLAAIDAVKPKKAKPEHDPWDGEGPPF